MLKKLFLIATYFIVALPVFAQTSNLTGKVTSLATSETLPGTTVTITERNLSATVNSAGEYFFRNVTPGNITLTFTNVGYETKSLTLDLAPGQALEINVELERRAAELEGVVVSTQRRTSTTTAVINEIKNTKAVMSGISKQQIALSQDNNAAQVMQRVPGVTVVDNKFIMVRGLSERYNNVMINDVVAPSTEVDRRTFSFDLIPSGALDRMMLFKSATPDQPGDFAGAVIKVYTNNEVPSNFTEISLGAGFRTNTTFQPYWQSNGSPLDILGMDNGYRSIPNGFPSTGALQESVRTSQLRQRAGRMLYNNWAIKESTALPDLKLGLAFGRKFRIGGINASNLTTFDISQNFSHYNREFNRFLEYDPTRPGIVEKRFAFQDDIYEKQNRVSLMSNFMFRLNPRNTIKFSNLFNQIGENETNLRQGEDFIQTLGYRRNYQLAYRSRSIYTGQFEGLHTLNPDSRLKWVLGGSYLLEKEPDMRRFRTYAPGGNANTPLSEFRMITPPSSNLFETARYFGNLDEFSVNQGLDYTLNFGDKNGGSRKELKAGYYVDYRDRVFNSRYMSFLIPGHIGVDRKSELEAMPIGTIFSIPNINSTNGFVLEEGTRPQDSYTASNFLTAGYASLMIPINRLIFTGGLRAEHNIQKMDSYANLNPVNVNNPILSLLPSLNVLFEQSTKSQFRVGYGRTVNRPEFRELAPFNFYDFRLDANRMGEPALKTATIDNADLRYEYYPRMGESISLGAFFKYFTNPIENRAVITSELPSFTYINADKAINYGAEAEIRKSLDQVFQAGFLSKTSVNINATYVFSEVDLGTQASAQQRVRPLQGQSPYIVNAALAYNDLQQKVMVSAAYNIFGRRLFAVGDVNNPDIWEMPRHSLDLTLSKTFNGLTLKAGVQDLLNYKYHFVQDSDRDGKANGELDKTVFSFKKGVLANLTITYRL